MAAPQRTHAWLLVLTLVGVDYFSTLAYLPSMAVEAAGPLAPLAAAGVVLVTFLLALPIYWYVVGRSPDGRGATGLLEDLTPGWRGKMIVLTLLGFAAADFVITRSLSLADAAIHLIHNPHGQRLLARLPQTFLGEDPTSWSWWERAAALVTMWRISWPFARRNVVGRLRRAQRPDWTITGRWLRVVAGLLPMLAPVLRSRRAGATPPGRDRADVPAWTSRLLGDIAPRPPQARPAGPLVVYVDVTETLRAGWRAGIQRVVTRLVGELTRDASLDVVPVIWSPLDGAWRRLDRDETGRLLDPPPMQNHPPATPPAPGRLRRLVGPVTRVGPLRRAKDDVRRRRALRRRDPAVAGLVLDRFEPGSVFFDPDASWNVVEAPRSELLPALRSGGVAAVAFLHDVLPMTDPEWFDPNLARVFDEHVLAHLEAGSLFLCNSRHTAGEVARVAAERGRPAPRTEVVGLGSDPHRRTPGPGALRPEIAAAIAERPHLLVVGTIEPRKNHGALLDAFDTMLAEGDDLGLVVVGRLGWRADEVGRRIVAHPEHGRRVFWPSSVDDDELAELYRRARVVVVPSLTEGFGLPVAEALSHGSVVVSSDGGALPEVGGDAVVRFDPADTAAMVAAIRSVVTDDGRWAESAARARTFAPATWADVAGAVAGALGAEAARVSSGTPR